MDSITVTDIDIPADDLAEVLRPWTFREHPVDAPAWERIRARKTRTFRKKTLRSKAMDLIRPFSRRSERGRTPEFVLDRYTETWSRYNWPDPAESPNKGNTVYLEWQGRGYETLRHGRIRCHLLGVAKIAQKLRPRTMLEVGAGPGINLVALSAMLPEIAFSGAELTPSGVATAKSIQSEPLPDDIEHFAPLPVVSRTAHQKIDFHQADARKLPFPDEAFDLVFTRLAIEQMENIRDDALAEIHRVTKSHAVFVEPFANINTTPLQALATRAKGFISLNVDDLLRYGFEPVFRFSDWPHKITNAAELVLCRKIARPG